jgi:hypothetical protein
MLYMESPTYIITYTNGRKTHESKRELEKTIDDLVDEEVAKIVKEYKFGRKIYVCTLYTNEQEFGAEEYITHYRALGKQYGHDFLTGFDMMVIRRFSV